MKVASTLFAIPLCIALAMSAATTSAVAEPIVMPLWTNAAPTGANTTEPQAGRITVHRPPEGKSNGAAIVICPGGGYGTLVVGPEGHGIATWLNKHGITGIVLEYRLPKGRQDVPLYDAARALRMAHFYAKDWNLDPKRIGIMGFSAGGHLASSVATTCSDSTSDSPDPIDQKSYAADFVILIYPVISMGELAHAGCRRNLLGEKPARGLIEEFSNEKHVTDATPPTFLAHAVDDKVVVIDHSRLFYQALKEHDVPAELLELPKGGHGLNGYKGPSWDAWQKRSLEWLAEREFIPKADAGK
jgi:acetyl esterase/lipase